MVREERGRKKAPPRKGRSYPLEFKMRVMRSIVDGGLSIYGAAKQFGLGPTTVKDWLLRYEAKGEKGLDTPVGSPPKVPGAVQKAVEDAKRERPEAGTRRIRDLLARFEAIGVSETQVRKILHEAGLMTSSPASREREEKPPRRFERARPNQMWQSDIFTFLLRKHQRVYLAGFMDDHSRFMVSHVVAHHQKNGLVMEALERGIAQFGAPSEILTDNGRQYTAWRGETEFEEALRQHGITHIKSRPQHPMTLGKILFAITDDVGPSTNVKLIGPDMNGCSATTRPFLADDPAPIPTLSFRPTFQDFLLDVQGIYSTQVVTLSCTAHDATATADLFLGVLPPARSYDASLIDGDVHLTWDNQGKLGVCTINLTNDVRFREDFVVEPSTGLERYDIRCTSSVGSASNLHALRVWWGDNDGTALFDGTPDIPVDVVTGSVNAVFAPRTGLWNPFITHDVGGDLIVAPDPDDAGEYRLRFDRLDFVGGDIVLLDHPKIIDGLFVFGQHLVGALHVARMGIESITVNFNDRIDGAVRIEENPALVSGAIYDTDMRGDVLLTANPSLVWFRFDAVTIGGALSVVDNPQLSGVLPPFTAGSVTIAGNTSLPCDVIEPIACVVSADAREVHDNLEPTCAFACP